MTKRFIIVALALAVVFGGVFGWRVFVNRQVAAHLAATGQPLMTVSATPAKVEQWHAEFTAVGSLSALNGVEVTTEVPGIVAAIRFTSGQDVQQGDVLVRLNDAPDRARLQGLEATAENARAQLERDKTLVAQHYSSRAQYDTDLAAVRSAEAQVANQKALIDQKTISAPFAGRLGVSQIDLGQYLAPGTAIVTLQALDPIHLDFMLPQGDLGQIKTGLPVEIKVDAFNDRTFNGSITTVSPKVDPATRNVPIQATVPNPDKMLLPGMFVNVRVILPAAQQVVVVPNAAITYNPYGNSVFVITRQNAQGSQRYVANNVTVTTGATRGDLVAVTRGVSAGDLVATSGQMKLTNGATVTVSNQVTPGANPNPNLPNGEAQAAAR